jgi:hypothetical protein
MKAMVWETMQGTTKAMARGLARAYRGQQAAAAQHRLRVAALPRGARQRVKMWAKV